MADLPKAILYAWPSSVWSTVPRICLFEKGYDQNEYIVKEVDITKGENFAPSYLKININGTIPTLVVPTLETTGPDTETRYRSLRDTITICDFLDQARGANSPSVASGKPAPALSPATIEGKAKSDKLIALVHLPTIDPNFLGMTARDKSELQRKAQGLQGNMLKDRKEALQRYVAEARDAAAKSPASSFEAKIVAFLEEKIIANDALYHVFHGGAGEEKEKAFFDASVAAWEKHTPEAFTSLEAEIDGPFTLGDQLCLSDCHVIAWITRLVTITGGKLDATGLDTLESRLGGAKIGPKTRKYWAAWTERGSFQSIYKEYLYSSVQQTHEVPTS